jgi:hypothetical protein
VATLQYLGTEIEPAVPVIEISFYSHLSFVLANWSFVSVQRYQRSHAVRLVKQSHIFTQTRPLLPSSDLLFVDRIKRTIVSTIYNVFSIPLRLKQSILDMPCTASLSRYRIFLHTLADTTTSSCFNDIERAKKKYRTQHKRVECEQDSW